MRKLIAGAILISTIAVMPTPIQAQTIKDEIRTEQAKTKATSFPDVESGAWYYNDVMDLVGRGVIGGYGDGSFKPQGTITFAEFINIAVRSVEKNIEPSDGSHWGNGVYRTGLARGIYVPSEFGGSSPELNKPLSREDMALILVRLNEISQKEAKADTSTTKGKIADFSKIAGNRQDAVLQAYQKGLLGGKGAGFDPKGTTTRAEASAVVMRLLDPSRRPNIDNAPTKPSAPVVDNELIITEGPYTGMMRTAKATEYHYAALKTARFYNEGSKYKVSIDLPTLPTGFNWEVGLSVDGKDGNRIYISDYDKYKISTGHVTFDVEGLTSLSQMEDAVLSVQVKNKDNKYMLTHKLATNQKDHVLSASSQGMKTHWEKFDTSSIYNWK